MNCRHSSTPSRRNWGWLKTGLLGAALALFGISANAQTIWNAGSFPFSNTSGVGTDNITAQTILTRAASGPIYNSACQGAPGGAGCSYTGPCNTQWALGTIANWSTLTYQNLYTANGCNPPGMNGQTWVCHLIAEDIYFQLTWGPYNASNFSYTRTTGPSNPVGTNGSSGLATGYPDLTSAITALNAATITSPVLIWVNSANPQTTPAGGYAITATGTAANTITIKGNGNTATAFTPQTSGNLNDAIFKIIGGDYITIQNFTMQENVANTTTAAGTNNMTEWGVALLYATTTNGAQNCSILGNTISLNRTYQNTFGIYSNSTHTATAVTTSASATTAAGGNSGLIIRSNNVSNVNNGIVVVGPTAAADANTGIDIGGSSLAQGNTLTNWGTTGTFSGYANVSGTVNGILVRNSKGYNVSYNSITSSVGGTTAGTLNGIQEPAASATPTGTFTNTINNNTINLQSAVTAGAINGINIPSGSATTTSVCNINNNNFTNLSHTVAGASGTITGIINVSTHLTMSISGNTFTNLAPNTTGSFTFISNNYALPAAAGAITASNNSIVTGFNKTGAGNTVTLYFTNTSPSSPIGSTKTYQNNNFSNITLTGATTMAGWTDLEGATGGGSTKTISNNTFNNWTCGTAAVTAIQTNFSGNNTSIASNTITNISAASSVVGISVGSSNGGATESVSLNTITNLSSTGGGVNAIQGGSTSITTAFNVNNNTIRTLSTTFLAAQVNGIISTAGGTMNIFKNSICDVQSNNTTTNSVNGIAVTAVTTVNIFNNRIADLRTPQSNQANGLNGILLSAPTTANVSYNTVLLNASSTGAVFGSTAMFAATGTNLTLRDNVFINNSTSNTTGLTVAYRRSSTTLTSYQAASNNNDFYAPNIFTDGTNTHTTLGAYKAFVGPRDAASVSENSTFLSTACGNANFLKIDPSVATQLESAGTPIAGITDDFDADTRNVSTPDVGADEFAGIVADFTGPAINYTPLTNSLCTTGNSLSATITDASGVNITPGTLPRLYYKKSGDANNYVGNTSADNGWKYVEASNASSPFSFTLNGTLLQAPITAGDVIQYFVVAQDLAGTPNVSINSGSFATAPSSVALTAAAFPLGGSINSYTVLNAVATSVTIGAAGTYTTITGAGGLFAAINAGGLSGNTVATVIDASVTEPGTFALNGIAYGCGGPATLTIKPQTTATLTGSVASGALIKLNGADNVIIDGSNSGGTDRSLTITNTNVTAPCAIWISSLGNGAGATSNTVKNCNINTSAATSATAYGIAVSGSTIASQGGDNDNTTIQNNAINSSNIGVYANGNAAVSTGGMDNLVVAGNAFTSSGTVAPTYGVQVMNALNASVSQNTVNLTTTAGTAPVGLSFETNVSGSSITKNQITSVFSSSTGGWAGRGITVGTGTTGSNILVANNFVAGVNGTNWSAFVNASAMGICIGVQGNNTSSLATTTGGVNVYHNSVNMTGSMGTVSTTAITAAFYVGSAVTALDLRDNIIVSTQTATSTTQKNYGIYCAAANTAFTNINYNDYYVSNSFNAGSAILGNIGGVDQTTMGAFTTAFGGNANSVNIAPVFTSTTDLHLPPASNATLDNLGQFIATVTTDIDGQTRSVTTPDMGADEFVVSSCTTAIGGTASGSTSFCNSGTPTITASGYSTGTGSTYQWYSSTNVGDYPNAGSAVGGQTNPASLTTGVVNTTTYYWLRVACATNSSISNSTMVTITVNPSAASITGPSSKCANDPAVTLTENGGTGTSWSWAPGGATTQSIAASPASTTTYTVTVTSPGPCVTTATKTVTVNANPTGVTAQATPSTICPGGTTNLTSTASLGGSANVFTEGFETGAAGWTFTDSSSTGAALPTQTWHVQASPYNDNTGSATFVNFAVSGSNFAYSNPDAGGSGSQTRTFMLSPSFSTTGFTGTGTLTFKNCYRYWSSSSPVEQVKVQITSNGGSTWTDLVNYVGTDVGTTTNGAQVAVTSTVSIPGAFMGQPAVKLRWRYLSNWGYFWIVDDIALSATPLPTYSWASTPSGFTSSQQNPSGVMPSGSTTYTVTVTGTGGCTATANTAVTVATVDDGDPCTLDACTGNGVVSHTFQDADSDGTCDANDGCPNDPNKIASGICGCGNPDTDSDGDGLANCVDPCPNLANLQNGDPCNDGNACTINDMVTACVCAGTFQDTDSDGICDANDNCPTVPGVQGSSCTDGDACTTGDVLNASCVCTGTFQDSDSDGLCDANDPCPNLAFLTNGDPCDDGNACTTGDVVTACVCAGTFTDTDSDGICDANDNCPNLAGQQGDVCNDGNPNTTGDVITPGCVCAGQLVDCEGTPGGSELPGTDCNDGNVCTINDTWSNACVCTGTFQDTDLDGICDANDNCPTLAGEQGDACNDGNACTTGDVITAGCVCAGTFQDTDSDGICDANDNCPTVPGVQGDPCNDGNVCTINDVITAGCICAGTFQDTDGDGICNANDNCPNLAGQQGDACNDGNACTIGDVITAGCVCAGTFQDTDGDGVCDANDNCPTVTGQVGSACTDGNVCTINDVLNASCVCTGTFQDTDGDGICNANDNCPTVPGVQGTACNDNNACTINDVLNASCVCAGTPDNTDTDGDGVPNCSDNCPAVFGQQGSACDDGNANTFGDVLDANCVCQGSTCAQNGVKLTLNTDAGGEQISWSIVEQTMAVTVCQGSNLPDNSTIIVDCCLADGCYDLTVTDMMGDGINPGGYVLRDGSGQRIIDNAGNGPTFSSISKSPLGFCVPLSAEALVPSSCDIENATLSTVLQAQPNAVVTNFWTSSNFSQQGYYGYQYWVTNPHGGFSRRVTLTLGAPGSAAPPGTHPRYKPTYFALSSMNSSAPFIPRDILLNVRVRAYINGVYGNFGPACRLKIPYPPCATTQLTTTPNPVVSCGATGLTLSSTIYADNVTGATQYQFEFTKPGYTRRITQTVRSTALNFVTSPLQNNNCYQVRIRVSIDGAQTYCPFGPYCSITIGTAICSPPPAMPLDPDDDVLTHDEVRLALWPNPNDGSQVQLSIMGFSPELSTVAMDVTDVFGQVVATRTIPVQDGQLMTTIDFENTLAPGLYLVNLQVGEERHTERLVIQR
jgi:hypothetical protein